MSSLSIYLKLPTRVKFHDWESLHPRDLMERIELLSELRRVPQNKLADILKLVTPRAAATIVSLIGGVV